MKFKYLNWAAVLVASLVICGLCIRSLSLRGVPFFESLVSRGFVCLLLSAAFGKARGLNLLPKSMKTQTTRALIAGLALSFFTLSYQWLTASAVAVLSNIDVPLLIVLGPIIGLRASNRIRSLSILSILLLMIYVSGLEHQADLAKGLIFLTVGSLLLCFGYLFIKKSMKEENEAVTILVPSVAIIVYGLVGGGISGFDWSHWSLMAVVETIGAGVTMFGAYYSTMRLYDLTDIATAEFPTLVSSIVIQPIEAALLGSPMHPVYFVCSLAFVAITYLILVLQKSADKLGDGAHAHA